MKSLVFFSILLCALIFGSVSWKSEAATNGVKQKAVAQFNSPVMVQGIALKGKFLFVHDDAAMARGDACTYIYNGEAEVPDQLVASFHCVHVERAKVRNFILRTRETTPGVVELVEFQFNGETAAHRVPRADNFAMLH